MFARSPEVSDLEALLDDDYDLFRIEQESTWPMGGPGLVLPKDQTDGAEIFTFDVLASKEDLPPGPTVGTTFVLLAERGPSGTAIVVPWTVATGQV